MSCTYIIDVAAILQAEAFPPEENIKEISTSDNSGFAELHPPHHTLTSDQHSLIGGELPGTIPSSDVP